MSEIFVNNNDVRFIDRLLFHLQSSSELKISVSYIRNSGVNPLIDEFEKFIGRSGKLQIITSAQMGITEREAIRSLLEIGANICVVREDDKRVFHAKGFIFKESESPAVIIGSANLTRSGLISGIEWGVEIVGNASFLESIEKEFDELWKSQHQVTLENLNEIIGESESRVANPIIESEDEFIDDHTDTLQEILEKYATYSVHKRPDWGGSWNFNLAVSKVERFLRSGHPFYVMFYCDFEAPTEKVFAIPSEYLKTNILPYAHKTNGTRYLINLNKSDLHFNWQRSIKMDGKPFLIKDGS